MWWVDADLMSAGCERGCGRRSHVTLGESQPQTSAGAARAVQLFHIWLGSWASQLCPFCQGEPRVRVPAGLPRGSPEFLVP